MIIKTALIDADILCYEMGSLKDDDTPEEPIGTIDLEEAVHYRIKSIQEGSRCAGRKLYLTGKGNFRNELATIQPYKGNRKDVEKPYHYKFMRDLFIEEYDAVVVDGMEADDMLAIEHTKDPKRSVICTRDKDLLQVAGWHYGWKCGRYIKERPLHRVSEWEGLYAHYSQMLTGDRVDNIKGLSGTKGKPGIGPATAKRLLAGCTTEMELYDVVLNQYVKKYGRGRVAEIYLLENARLLYMLRTEDDVWVDPHSRLLVREGGTPPPMYCPLPKNANSTLWRCP